MNLTFMTTCWLVVSIFLQAKQLQKPPIELTVSDDSVRVAESLDVTLTVRVPKGSAVKFNSLSEDELGDLIVTSTQDVSDMPDSKEIDQRIWKRTYTIMSFASGDQLFPAIQVSVSDSNESMTYRAPTQTIKVLSDLNREGENPELRAIHATIDIDNPNEQSRYTLIAVCVASGIGVLALVVFGNRLRNLLPQPSTLDLAMKRLDMVSVPARGVEVKSETAESICQELETILREYLRIGASIPSTGMSRSQLAEATGQALGTSSEPGHNRIARHLEALLEEMEQIRFAKQQPSADSLAELTKRTRQWLPEFASAFESAPKEPHLDSEVR